MLAKASPLRSGDRLAGLVATTYEERVAAQIALADVPLTQFLTEAVIPYETDDVTRLIIDTHDAAAFSPISHFTVGDLRDWLLGDETDSETLRALAPGLTPEMVSAVSKLMRNQELILVAKKIQVVYAFPKYGGLAGSSVRPVAAKPPHRRCKRNSRQYHRRVTLRQWRRDDWHQPRYG